MLSRRKLGNSSLMVPPLAFGGNVFGWTIDEKRSFEILDELLANDFNFIDTADVYSRWASGVGGESETIIGKWMKSRNNRKRIILATKVGMDIGQGKTSLAKDYILKAVDQSLQRLQTDYIDLYQSHKDDEGTPVQETLEAYDILIKQGKVRYIGASNFSPARLRESLDASVEFNLPRYESLQPLYNLYDRAPFENELQSICLEHNIGVINYYALASGFLSGKYRTEEDAGKSVRGAKAMTYMTEKGRRILQALDEVAKSHNTEMASVAIAWLLTRPAITAPIASATNMHQLKSLLDATSLVLSQHEVALLTQASE
jgi:aryl-alcohol dehydrogenase-like predicted oxidoreductase